MAEFGIWLARPRGKRAIYTAPVKALSNQKFRDLRRATEPPRFGLLTGDIVENPRARIVVMTTEIYRNMLLEGLRAATSPAEEAAELLAQVNAAPRRASAASSRRRGGCRRVAAAPAG